MQSIQTPPQQKLAIEGERAGELTIDNSKFEKCCSLKLDYPKCWLLGEGVGWMEGVGQMGGGVKMDYQVN